MVGEIPEEEFRWWGRWWVVVGCMVFDLGEVRDGGEGRELCTAEGKMRERGEKRDLKAGHKRPETEYVRTYRFTFDRTHAGE
jgi:hypothetical protein